MNFQDRYDMSDIGILGGTFDPIHNGHITLAKRAYESFNLDKILIMPSKKPPHKKTRVITEDNHRINMVKLAIKDYPYMEFSDFEMKREGYIYTADTLTLLKKAYPENNYFFILGGDSIRNLESWYNPEIILEKAVIISSLRDGITDTAYENIVTNLIKTYKASNPDIRKLPMENINISSSDIRNNFYTDENIHSYLNRDVVQYIIDNRLYYINY
ncbi:MAG: nicotinate-nucleotide adenylyltransferase [Lachnospiraceae bacterium]|nr:nicotinate-nucleotide adenylyltransferase [Lachnospiraceae bacterium]